MTEHKQTVYQEVTFDDALSAYTNARFDLENAKRLLASKEGACRAAFAVMKALCDHPGGFVWNGFGSEGGSNQRCELCGTYKADAKAKA